MSKLKVNIAANIGGASVGAFTQLVCAPIYVRLLGIDAYGLVGFFLTLQASLRVLDLGLAPTLNRQLARYSVQMEKAQESRDFVRTLEVVYLLMGLIVVIAICLAAPVIADRWIKHGAIPVWEVRRAVVLMGVLVAVQWPLSLYQGGLLGLQRQVEMNVVRSVAAVFNGGGAVLVLWCFSGNILTFFVWQVLANFAYVLTMAIVLWTKLPPASRRARFDIRPLREVASFTGGMSGTAVAGVALTQMDKIILSKILPLALFGYYSLGVLIANSLQLFIGPLFNALFPRLSALVAHGDEQGVHRVYHQGSQTMAALIFPLTLLLALFAPEVLRLWTGNAAVAANVAPIVQFLVVGTAINGIMYLPYALQLANGWTSLSLVVSVCMCVTIIPTVYLLASRYGGPGAAAGWLIVNLLNFAIAFPLTHRRLLPREAWKWLGQDICPPLVGAAAVVLLGRRFMPLVGDRIEASGELVLLLLLAYIVTAVCTPSIRAWSRGQLRLLAASSR